MTIKLIIFPYLYALTSFWFLFLGSLHRKPETNERNKPMLNMNKAAEYYLYIKKLEKAYVRIDVIEVYIKGNKYYINHIKKQW